MVYFKYSFSLFQKTMGSVGEVAAGDPCRPQVYSGEIDVQDDMITPLCRRSGLIYAPPPLPPPPPPPKYMYEE